MGCLSLHQGLPSQPYRSEVPQHQHHDSISRMVGCGIFVLTDQYDCCCGKFGTKRPQVQILSPRPIFPQVADLRECRFLRRCSIPQRSPPRPRGNKRNAGATATGRENTRAPSTTQQTTRRSRVPSGHRDPPSTTKRSLRAGRPPTRNHRRSEVGKLVRLGTVAERPLGGDPVDPSALNSTLSA